MEVAVILGVIGLVLYVIVREVTDDDPYSTMTSREFEEQARHTSVTGHMVLNFQKFVDPSHSVEYIQQEDKRLEGESSEAGDAPHTVPPAEGS